MEANEAGMSSGNFQLPQSCYEKFDEMKKCFRYARL